jgi:hypothetical protein
MYDVLRNILDLEASASKGHRLRTNAVGKWLTPIPIKKPLCVSNLDLVLHVARRIMHISTRAHRLV